MASWDDEEADAAISGGTAKKEEPPAAAPAEPGAAQTEVTDPNIRVPLPEESVGTLPDDPLVSEEGLQGTDDGGAVPQNRNPPPVFVATRAERGVKDLPRANRGARQEAPLVQRPRNRT